MQKTTRFAFILFGILTTLLLLEVIFRISNLNHQQIKSDRPSFYYKHWASPSMRDFIYDIQKPKNTFRAAIIGDSFTFGSSIQFDDTYPKRIERMLNLSQNEIWSEFMNFGIPEYSLKDKKELISKALKYNPDLLILQINLNDFYLNTDNKSTLKDKNKFLKVNKTENFLTKNFTLVNIASKILDTYKAQATYKKFYLDLVSNETSWTNFKNTIASIQKNCVEQNRHFAVIMFPLFGFPIDKNYPFLKTHLKIKNFLTSQNIKNLDLLEKFKNLSIKALRVNSNTNFLPNERAHRIAAEEVYLWLEKNKLILQKIKLKEKFTQRVNIKPNKNFPSNMHFSNLEN